MSGPPPSNVPPAGPPPPPPYPPGPPYGPYYPGYPPPPPRSNLALILLIVVVLLVVGSAVMSAILYVMVSGLIRAPSNAPIILLGRVDQTGGNATIPIRSASSMAPANLQMVLQANGSTSSATSLPPPDGSVLLGVGTYSLRVFWLDGTGDGLVGAGDAFRVTGDLGPLPRATSFTFTLRFHEGTSQGDSSTGWSTA